MSKTLLSTNSGKGLAGHGAITHGILSNHQLLPWENGSEFNSLMQNLQSEYQPSGQTEHHLVEELAGIIWRKKRLRQAEAAHHHKELRRAVNHGSNVNAAMIAEFTSAKASDFSNVAAIISSDTENAEELAAINEYRKPALEAKARLDAGADFSTAFALLHPITQEWWQEDALGQPNRYGTFDYEETPEHLLYFLNREVLEHYHQQHEEVRFRPQIKQQLEGEALIPSKQFEKFSRYEVHLDRKFERTLTVLIRVQEMRANRESNQTPA